MREVGRKITRKSAKNMLIIQKTKAHFKMVEEALDKESLNGLNKGKR